jgi:hypothetical protein
MHHIVKAVRDVLAHVSQFPARARGNAEHCQAFETAESRARVLA